MSAMVFSVFSFFFALLYLLHLLLLELDFFSQVVNQGQSVLRFFVLGRWHITLTLQFVYRLKIRISIEH